MEHTIRKCVKKLRGTYGFKRFLRDGQYTDLESKTERFYEAAEVKVNTVTMQNKWNINMNTIILEIRQQRMWMADVFCRNGN